MVGKIFGKAAVSRLEAASLLAECDWMGGGE